MKRFLTLILLTACANAPKPDPAREELSRTHRELFEFMGLSKPAVDELVGKVEWVYDGIRKHKADAPEAHAALEGVTARGNPSNHAEALSAHRKRFELLELTPATQKELEDAFTLVYEELRTPNPSPRALKIRDLMKQLPPCCDDNIFKRAGAGQ